MSDHANLRWGILYMLASVLALGFMPSLVRLIYEASELTALQVSAWRFILAAPLLWLFTMLQHREAHPFSRRSQAMFGRAGTVGIFYGLAVVAFFSSLERIPVPVFILIFYSYPIIVALLSRVLGERLSHWFWPAALLTLGGIALTVVAEGEDVWLGAVLALVAAYLIATYFVVNQRILRRWYGDRDASNVAIGVAWIVTSGAVTLALIAFLSGALVLGSAALRVWRQLHDYPFARYLSGNLAALSGYQLLALPAGGADDVVAAHHCAPSRGAGNGGAKATAQRDGRIA